MGTKTLEGIDDEKPMTVRLTQTDWDYICKRGDSRICNKALQNIIGQLRRLEGQSLLELSGYFTPEEWIFFTIILRKKFVASKEELATMIADTENFKPKSKPVGINVKEMLAKVNKLNAVHVNAIQSRIIDFWDNCMLIDQDAWSRAI